MIKDNLITTYEGWELRTVGGIRAHFFPFTSVPSGRIAYYIQHSCARDLTKGNMLILSPLDIAYGVEMDSPIPSEESGLSGVHCWGCQVNLTIKARNYLQATLELLKRTS